MPSNGEGAFFLELDLLHVFDVDVDDQLVVKERPDNTYDAADDDGPGGGSERHRRLTEG